MSGRANALRARGLGALLGTVVGNAPGLILPFLVTATIGAGRTTDVYFFALGLAIFGSSVSTVVVEANALPIVQRARVHGGAAVRRAARSTVLQAVGGVTSVYVLVVVLAMTLILAQGSWARAEREAALATAAILTGLVALVSANSVLAAVSYATGDFLVPTTTQSFRSLFPLAGLPLIDGSLRSIQILACLMVAGEACRSITLLRLLKRRIQTNGGTGTLTRSSLWRTAGPHGLAVVIGNLIPVTNRLIAVPLAVGAVTLVDVSEKVFWVPMLAISSGLVLVPSAQWATAHEPGSAGVVSASLRSTLRRVAFAGAASALLIAMGAALVAIVSPGRALGIDSGEFAAMVACLGIGLPGAAIGFAGARFLAAVQETRPLPFLAAATLTMSVVTALAGSHLLGVLGIALAASLTRSASAVIYILLCKQALRRLSDGVLPANANPRTEVTAH